MKKIVLLVAIATLFSCIDVLEDNEVYYEFSNSDFDFIPTSYEEVGKEILFKNQNNEEVTFKVQWYEINKEFSSGLSTDGHSAYYYDKLTINLSLLDMNNCFGIDINITKSGNGGLFQQLSLPNYDGGCQGDIHQFRTPELNNYVLGEMEINNKLYNNVLTFNVSGGMIDYYSFYDNSTIHKVYYDLVYGVIGFDDTINNLFYRIVN